MSTLNKAMILGRLGRDPEVRYTPGNVPVANISIATNSRSKDKSGEWQDVTEWHKIVLFNKNAEIAEKYLDKGSSVYVEGKIQTRKWQDKDGNDRWTTEVLGNQLTMLGSRSSSDSSPQAESRSNTPFPEDDSGPGLTDDDIPF